MSTRQVLFRLVAVLWGLFLGLALVELASYFLVSSLDRTALRVFEASDSGTVAGIGIRKNFQQTWKSAEFEVTIRTNNIGLREDWDYEGQSIDIGFLGDSFTFGHGVEAEERYSNQLGRLLPGTTVASFSYLNGWTTPHYYLFLKKHPELNPRIAIVGLFLVNDLSCDVEESTLHFDSAGELISIDTERQANLRGFLMNRNHDPVTRLILRTWFGEWLARNRYLAKLGLRPRFSRVPNQYPPIELERGQLDETNRIGLSYLIKIREHLESQGKRLIVFLIPGSYVVGSYASPFDAETTRQLRKGRFLATTLEQWCIEHSVECIDPLDAFREEERRGSRLYYAKDGHWTPAGHRRAAELIAEHLVGDGTYPP